MNHSMTIDVALCELSKAQETYALAVESFRQLRKSRGAQLKEFQNSEYNTIQKKSYETKVQQEKAAESSVRLAMDSLKKKQSNYDKFKQQATVERKAQKRLDGKNQKHTEQQMKREDRNNANNDENINEDEKDEEGDEPRGREKFLRDNYQHRQLEERDIPKVPARKFTAVPSAWKIACDQALSDRSQMKSFPDPPYKGCGNRNCTLSRNQRFLKACRCNIADAFMRDPDYPECMKAERLKWHPDKFSACPENRREVFQEKAREIFVVANLLYQRDGRDV